MKKILLTAAAAVFFTYLFSQDHPNTPADTSWKKGGLGTLNFSQSSYTNWAAGGENSIAATGIVNLFANYKKGANSWDNVLDLAYGKIRTGTARSVRKSDDKIDFSSKYGRYAFAKVWYYSLLFNFKSQFDQGYSYPNDSVVVSRFMAPAYFLLAAGLDYKPKDYFSVFISPVTAKLTVVSDQVLADAGAYGVEKAVTDNTGKIITHGKKTLEELGGYLRITFKKDVIKNVNLGTRLELFSNYLKSPQNVVVNWDITLGMKVNKYIAASVSTSLIYDDKITIKQDKNGDGIYEVNGPRTQFKEVLAVGLSYKF